MKKSVLHLFKHTDGGYHTVFKTDHGRKIYLLLSCHHGICTVGECCYLDRSVPKLKFFVLPMKNWRAVSRTLPSQSRIHLCLTVRSAADCKKRSNQLQTKSSDYDGKEYL